MLKGNAVKEGLRASAAYYNQVWARDAFISFLGANQLRDRALLRSAKRTVLTFAKTASPLGQIANFFDLRLNSPEYGYSGSTDSTAWYIIGLASLYSVTGDRSLLADPLMAAVNAYRWLRYQDANNSWLIDSPPGADWMDAAVQRTGKTLYNNVLFLMATMALEPLMREGETKGDGLLLDQIELRRRFEDVFLPGDMSAKRLARYWPRLSEAYARSLPRGFDGEYYMQAISFSRLDSRFDTFSNLLAVLSGVADRKTTDGIIGTIKSRHLTQPFPIRVLDPPYEAEGAGFDQGFNQLLPVQHRSEAFAYHNGAVWPFVGGTHVAALFRLGDRSAKAELESLATANGLKRSGDDLGFNEWLHGESGKPMGQFGQSWSAAWFIGAKLASEGADAFGFLRS